MSVFNKFNINYDSPLRKISYLEFKDYIPNIESINKKESHFSIKNQINLKNKSALSLFFRKAFHRENSYEQLINYMIFGFPRCLLDLSLFEIEVITRTKYDELKRKMTTAEGKNLNILKVLTNFIGFEKVPEEHEVFSEDIGIYFITQTCNDISNIKILKKIYINWQNFDPPFSEFRKKIYKLKEVTLLKPFNCFKEELKYYLEVWFKQYDISEFYFLKYLAEKSKQAEDNEPIAERSNLKHKISLKAFAISQQQSAIKKLIFSSRNPLLSKFLETKFYWKRPHLQEYVSWVCVVSAKVPVSKDKIIPITKFKNTTPPLNSKNFENETTDSSLYKQEVYNFASNKTNFDFLNNFKIDQKEILQVKNLKLLNTATSGSACTKNNSQYYSKNSSKDKENSELFSNLTETLEDTLKVEIELFNNFKNCQILIQNLYKTEKKDLIFFLKNQILTSSTTNLTRGLLLKNNTFTESGNSNILVVTEKKIELKYLSLYNSNFDFDFDSFWNLICEYLIIMLAKASTDFNEIFVRFQYSLHDYEKSPYDSLVENNFKINFLTTRKHEFDIVTEEDFKLNASERLLHIKKEVYRYWEYLK